MGSNASRKPDKLTVVKMAVQHIRILGRVYYNNSLIILFTISIDASHCNTEILLYLCIWM